MAEPSRRKALFVGIDDYREAPLSGCVSDAEAMAEMLHRNHDGSLNYSPLTRVSPNRRGDEVTRHALRDSLATLFANSEDHDILFYFAGHGAKTDFGTELVCQDYVPPNSYGVSMSDIATLANTARARSVVVILDCCYSGEIGLTQSRDPYGRNEIASLAREVTLIAASRAAEEANENEEGTHGAFTEVLLEGLRGAAAEPLGEVTISGLQSFVSHRFADAWGQRPVIKTHSAFAPVLRRAEPSVERPTLESLIDHFAAPDSVIDLAATDLDPTEVAGGTEPSDAQRAFVQLARLRAIGLVAVDGATEVSLAIERGGRAQLTAKGRNYWRLIYDDAV